MAILYTSTVLFSLVLALGTMAITSTAKNVTIPPVVIPGNGVAECPLDADRQNALRLLRSRTEHALQILQNYSNNSNCGPGLWRRVFYLNTSSQNQSCPGDWNIHTSSSVRGCAGAGESCRSAYSDEVHLQYDKVCGRAVGRSTTSPDGFFRVISGQTTVEDIYLDGVSVTHGAPGSRTHIWSFGAGHTVRCPCDNSNRIYAPLPPPEVGENYFCSKTGSGGLWTGTDCTSDNPCCSFHNPPYFSAQFPSPTTDQIELRICTDQDMRDEYILVQFAEIYVQ